MRGRSRVGTPRLRGLVARVVDARPDELGALAWAFAQVLLVLASMYVVRPLRDELGIRSGVEDMQWLFTGTFVGVAIVVPIYGWAAAKLGRRRLVPIVHLGLAISLVACFLVERVVPEDALPLHAAFVFVWLSVLNLLALSVFWSLMADLFDPEQGRRLFGFIAAGGSIGALLGPTIAAVVVEFFAPMQLLLVGAVLLAGAAWCASRQHTSTTHAHAPIGGSLWAGFRLILATPTLRGLSAYLLCMTWINTIFYFEQAHIISETITDSNVRTALFARMDLAVNVLSLLVQTLFTGRLIARVGLGAVLVALPLVAVGSLASLALVPTLGVLVGVQVSRRSVEFALSKPAREALFTGLDREAKYKGKNVVDTFVYRGGDAIAGWGFTGLRALGLPLTAIAWLGLPVAALWALVARRIPTHDT
jgi:AAA family ATP:ADP antiporter